MGPNKRLTNGKVLEPTVRNFRTPLSPGTRPGSIIRHQKRKNNPVSGNIQSRQSRVSSNKHCLPAKGRRALPGTRRVYWCASSKKRAKKMFWIRINYDYLCIILNGKTVTARRCRTFIELVGGKRTHSTRNVITASDTPDERVCFRETPFVRARTSTARFR